MVHRLKEFLKKSSENEKTIEKLRALQKYKNGIVTVGKIIKLTKRADILLTEEDVNAEYGEINEAELANVTCGWKTCFYAQAGNSLSSQASPSGGKNET